VFHSSEAEPRHSYRKELEARVRIELTIEVLQTSALPLGYRAGWFTNSLPKKSFLGESHCPQRLKQAAEKFIGRVKSSPQALKREQI
jgi:hypothetical protein